MKKEEANSYLHKKIEDGEQVSPVLPEGVKNYLIDIDGTKSIELGAFGIPETYLVNNKNKEIIKKYIGPLDDKKFKEILKIIKNEKI